MLLLRYYVPICNYWSSVSLTHHPCYVHSSSEAPFWLLGLWLRGLWRSTLKESYSNFHLAGSRENKCLIYDTYLFTKLSNKCGYYVYMEEVWLFFHHINYIPPHLMHWSCQPSINCEENCKQADLRMCLLCCVSMHHLFWDVVWALTS